MNEFVHKFLNKFINEYRLFCSYPRDMRVLLMTNLIYALVMPVIELFIGAYVMRQSGEVTKVVIYQLAVYTGIPFTFLINGWLLRHIRIHRLYSLGMLLSGISMVVMMSLPELTLQGLAAAGLLMGMSFGLYWSNRDFLALDSTNDTNRNYYYGLENFFSTIIAIIVPGLIGAFIGKYAGGDAALISRAYQIVTGVVFVLTLIASIVCHMGRFQNPPDTKFIYLRYHWLWNRMQLLAILKGMVSGYIVTAPAMLMMRQGGSENALGQILTGGAILSAILLYILGRVTEPRHRIYLYAVGLVLFALGAVPNALFFNPMGVMIFMIAMVLARPLSEIAFFTIQMLNIDTVSAQEKRNKYAYILNQEIGNYVGRLLGLGMFLVLAYKISDVFALRYALLIVGLVQILAVWVAQTILKGCAELEAQTLQPEVEGEGWTGLGSPNLPAEIL